MKYLVNTSTDPHFNMAFDEFCLERLQAEEPVFYLWQNRPAVIIGLNQNAYAEVNLPYLEKNGIARIVRYMPDEGSFNFARICNIGVREASGEYILLLNNDTSSLVNGDVDGDGNITSADITTVYNILLGNN